MFSENPKCFLLSEFPKQVPLHMEFSLGNCNSGFVVMLRSNVIEFILKKGGLKL